MVDESVLSHRQLIRKLVMLCKEKSSGTVFFNLENGESARLVLNRGRICWAAYQDLRGMPAIDSMSDIESARLNFNSNLKLVIGEQGLPSTPEVLRKLNTRANDQNDQAMPVPTVTEVVSHTEMTDNDAGTGESFERERVRQVLEQESMEFLGPMARILCEDYIKSMPSQLSFVQVRKLISAVTRDIGDERKGADFVKKVENALKIL